MDVLALSSTVGMQSACDSLGVVRASLYRQRPVFGPGTKPVPLVDMKRPTTDGSSAGYAANR